jgi:hypothetical protein
MKKPHPRMDQRPPDKRCHLLTAEPPKEGTMKHSDTRVPRARWNALGKIAASVGVAAIIGFAAIAPAKADYDDWRYRQHWREHHRSYGYSYSYPSYGYYSYSYPSYSYYSYPSYGYYSYPSYGYYSPYYGGYGYDYGTDYGR